MTTRDDEQVQTVDAAQSPDQAGHAPVRVVAEVDHAGQRIDRFLADQMSALSRTRLQQLIRSGSVTVDEMPATLRHKVKAGEQFAIKIPPPVNALPEPQDLPLDVLYEDASLIVLNKPAGMVVHPAPGHASGTLVNALLAHCKGELSGIGGVRRPGIVHRLDKDTSGLLVVAKNDQAHTELSAQFAAHGSDGRLHRAYAALCWGRPLHAKGRIEARLDRSRTNRQKMAVVSGEQGRFAATQYEMVWHLAEPQPDDPQPGDHRPVDPKARFRASRADAHEAATHATGLANANPSSIASELRLTLETGRTHQVRVHMAHIGCPVIGDPVYATGHRSRARCFPAETVALLDGTVRQMLHAQELAFDHPKTGQSMRFHTDPPADFCHLRNRLQNK
ncbi:MAG: RluA family pseudouridine synthase [Pseudomonadota bacterium]